LSTPDLPAPEAPADEIADAELIDAPPVPELPVGGKGKARRKRKPRRRKNEVASEAAPVEPNQEQAAPTEASPLPMNDHGQVPSEPSPEAAEEREESPEHSLTEQRAPALLPADEIVDFDVQSALDRDRAADSTEIEVLAPTAPEPESALPMGQSDPGLQLPLLEADSIDPAGPSDTGFARAVQDFASDESGPLVEEIPQRIEEPAPVLAPAPASQAPPAEQISTPPQMPLLAETLPAIAEAPAPIEPEISLVEESTAPAEAAPAPVKEHAPESAAPIVQVASEQVASEQVASGEFGSGEVGSGEELAPLAELQPSQFPAGASQLDLEPLAPADLHADDQPGDQQFFDLTAASEVAAAPEQATEISSPEVVPPAESALEASQAPEPLQLHAETIQSPLEPELHLEPGPIPPPAVSPDQGQAPAPAAPGGDAASWGANQDHFFGGMPLKLGPGSQSRPSRAQPAKTSAEPVAPAARAPSAPQPARPAPPKPQPRKPGEAPTRIPPRPVPRTGPTTTANPFADGKRRAINAGDRQVRTAFDGLAYSPVRQADVFGQAQVPGSLTAGFDPSLMNDVFGGAAIRRGLMTPTGASPVVPPTGQPARPGEESPQGASRGPNPKRMPATIPEPAPRAKKRRWFGLLGLLMLAILGCVAATAGIYSQIPAGSSVSGTLHFANMDSVTRQERKSIGESLLASMDNSANVRAEFDLDKGVLTLTSAGGASQSDQHRMLELLQAVYQKNQQRVAEAGGLRDTVSALKSAMQATQSRIDDAQRQIDALKTVMPGASDKKQLESEVSRLESAYNEAVANVARLQAELKQLRARPSPSSQTNAAPKAVSQPAPAPADDFELASAEPVMLHPDPRWKNDPALHKLMQQQAIQLRRYNAAVAAGLSDDAANLKARLSTLDRAIRDRQADLGGQPLAHAGPKARALNAHSRTKPPVTIASFSIAAVSNSASSDASSAQQPDATASVIVKKQEELADAEQARDQAEAAFHDAAKRLRELNDRIDAVRASQEKSASLIAERDRQKQSLIQQQKQYELQMQQARSTAYPLEPTAADVTADVQPDPRPTYAMIACGSIVLVVGILAILLVLNTRAPRRAQEPNPAGSLADLPDYPMLPPSRRQPAQSISAPATNLVEV
jgi:predicted  nucleic acid-binding Zn-ribbon protein